MTKACFIYFVSAGKDGPIKIGRTRDPGKRLSQLQNGNHKELDMIGSFFGDEMDESWLHELLETFRLRGEWYHRHPTILNVMAGLCGSAEGEASRAIEFAIWLKNKAGEDTRLGLNAAEAEVNATIASIKQ